VLPLAEFTVMIPEQHAALKGAIIWRNQCHDRATLHPPYLKSCFAIFDFFFKCSLSFDERRVSYTLVPL